MTTITTVEQIISDVLDKVGDKEELSTHPATNYTPSVPAENVMPVKQAKTNSMTEFVGTAIGDTIGLVIANVDSQLLEVMDLEKKYRSIGILGARTGAGPHILAADEAVKATNTEVVKIELARDTKGGAGHGSLIIFGGSDVSDVKRAVEVALSQLERTFGDVYANDAGHIELQYSARASHALEKAFGAPLGRACGVIVGAPASIGVLMADAALKAANVNTVAYSSPAKGTSFSNEAILVVSGDSGAVRQSVMTARDVGVSLLETMGGPAPSQTKPYI
ncbi:propanediol utilization microcompartment protein PduB [Photobacterium sp. DNB22_13_2]